MKTQARVGRIEDGAVWLDVVRDSGCGRCSEAGGCRSGLLDQIVRPSPGGEFRVANDSDLKPGEWVTLEIPDGELWRSAAVAYGGPLIALILGAAFGASLGSDRLGADLGALSGAALAVGTWYGLSRPIRARKPGLLVSRGEAPCRETS